MCAVSARGAGIDLKVGEQVVCDSHDLLPGAVGAKSIGRNGVKCQMALELSDDPLMSAATTHIVPQLLRSPREIRRDG